MMSEPQKENPNTARQKKNPRQKRVSERLSFSYAILSCKSKEFFLLTGNPPLLLMT
jgi:hypothetical protein